MAQQRILVVDDDQKFLHFITEVLTGAGYDVRAAEGPLTAMMLAEEFQPSLIVVDIAMPGKDGLELSEELRVNQKTADIPRMFLTARTASEGMQPAQNVGAVAYLEKPVKTSTLLWTIKALLEGK